MALTKEERDLVRAARRSAFMPSDHDFDIGPDGNHVALHRSVHRRVAKRALHGFKGCVTPWSLTDEQQALAYVDSVYGTE